MIKLSPCDSSIHASGRLSVLLGCPRRARDERKREASWSVPECSTLPSLSWPSVITLRILRTLLDGGRGEDAVTDGAASDLEVSSEGLRFFLVCLDGSGTSSSCDVLRLLRKDRVPSVGSSGSINSLKIE